MQEKTKINEIELYQILCEDLQAIITERIWRSKIEVIVAYGEVGHRIVTDALYEKYSSQSKDFLEKLAKSIGISYSTICRAIQFWNKYHIDSHTCESSWDKLPEGKNISWYKICSKYLPQTKGDTELQLVPKFKIGDEVEINLKRAIILLVKDTGRKVVYKVEIELDNDEKEDLWLEEKFLKGL